MMYTRLLSLLFALLLTVSSLNAGVLLLDGIESGRQAGNVLFSYTDGKFTAETVEIYSIYNSNGSFVKDVILTPSISTEVVTNLSNGKYIIKSYNTVSGQSKTIPFLVSN